MMSIITEYQVSARCGECGEKEVTGAMFYECGDNPFVSFLTQKFIEELRKKGWSIGKTVKCPECMKKARCYSLFP